MGNREAHKQDLFGLFAGFAATGDTGPVTAYLLSNSNLPGPRGNLELAQAFADVVGALAGQDIEFAVLWSQCKSMAEIPADVAPANGPREFIPFCGTVGIGALGAANAGYLEPALGMLRGLARDPRWRMREAVCFGLQRLMAVDSDATLRALDAWVVGGDALEMRAVAAGVAEPPLLSDTATAVVALRLHQGILDKVRRREDRTSDAFRTLRKGLGYTLSVVVCAVPQEGFAFLGELAKYEDRDLHWIVKENLKKNRLVKNFPAEVSLLKASL
jgi:hypothetical protein